MPRKSLQINLEVVVQAVTCPGVILKDRGDVFLRIVLLGFQRNSLCLPPVFPLLYHQTFTFNRAFPGCSRLIDLEQVLEEEPVLLELIQLDEEDLTDGARVIAFYHSSIKEFLFPRDSLIPTYADSEQEVLMQRTFWFSGISPKLEFSSKTTISDTSTPVLDSYFENGAENTSKSKSVSFVRGSSKKAKRRTKSYGSPSSNSSILKSSSRTRVPRLKTSKMDERAPFIIKRKDSFNRAVSPSRARSPSPRRPASAPPKTSQSIKRKSLLPLQEKVPSCYISEEECRICQVYHRYLGRRYWGHKKYYHPSRETPNGSKLVQVEEDEYRNFPHRLSSSFVDDETDDIINGMNSLQFKEDPPLPGPVVEYGRLPYSPRLSRRRTRSPTRLRARSASPRGRLDISGQIRRRVQRALENEYVTSSEGSEISSVTSDEAMDSLRMTMLTSPRRRYINY
ncbi:uncharacterized protein [Apostichopus japonicus]|uniref:uncharacterized protein isoform X2 n=1 Tax=Stichopus japonicus TaxID=307972 RepID=UPI003AB5CCBB